jgi:D-amino peptidase
VEKALNAASLPNIPSIPQGCEVTIEFNNPVDAYRASWYPGAKASGPRAVAFSSADFFEIQRALRFMNS